MARRVRLLARYAADFVVHLHGALWPEPKQFQAKDISRGGLFVRTQEEPEIFSDVRIRVVLPWGGDLNLRARIVHIMTAEKAQAIGMEPGLGIEFQDLGGVEKEGVERLVTWARDSDPGRCVPKRTAEGAPPDLNPMLGYVLGAVDGALSIDEIAEHLELESAAAESVLIQLNDLKLVNLGDSATIEQLSLRASARGGKRAGAPEASQVPLEPARPATPQAAADQTQAPQRPALTAEQQTSIDAVFARLAGDHYQVLAVLPKADRDQIRNAYFSLSKQFHPDAFRAHELGAHQSKLSEIFERLTEAYAALSNPVSRQQYDEYLRRSQDLSAPKLPVAPVPAVAAPLGAGSHVPPTVRYPTASAKASQGPAVTVRSQTSNASQVPATVRYQTANVSRVPISGGGPGGGAVPSSAASAEPGSVDLVRMHLVQAAKACEAGDMKAAARSLDLLEALQWDRPEFRELFQELDKKVSVALADAFEQQARYEVKQQRWKQAARSWMKVCRGRPNDPECHSGAAEALLMGKLDLRKARDLAQRAVDLAPKDAKARRILGHVYLDAGFHLNARRELEAAAALNRDDDDTKRLLNRIPGAKA